MAFVCVECGQDSEPMALADNGDDRYAVGYCPTHSPWTSKEGKGGTPSVNNRPSVALIREDLWREGIAVKRGRRIEAKPESWL